MLLLGTVFIPDNTLGRVAGLTYAEIVEDSGSGLSFKLQEL